MVYLMATGRRRIPAPPPACGEMIMLTLKVLSCLALSALLLVPVTLYKSNPAAVQAVDIPHVDAQAMWSRWERR